jgi:hypothetical protein
MSAKKNETLAEIGRRLRGGGLSVLGVGLAIALAAA